MSRLLNFVLLLSRQPHTFLHCRCSTFIPGHLSPPSPHHPSLPPNLPLQANPTPSSAASLLLGVEQLLSYAGQLQPSWRAIQPTWMTQVAVPSRTMGEVALLLAVLQQFVMPAARSLTRHVSSGGVGWVWGR